MKKRLLISLLITTIISCQFEKKGNTNLVVSNSKIKKIVSNEIKKKVVDTIKFTNGFDFPVGKPDGKKYYNAQKFGENQHLGDDWNGIGGGNTDLGDTIYSIGNGYVSFASNIYGGWGNVITIVHYIDKETQVESLYAHCDEILITKGDYIKKGQKIGTIGNNDGAYLAHLHLELRSEIGLSIGNGYSSTTTGYLDPSKFIDNNR